VELYLVTNLIDGTRYVGKTTQTVAARWKKHQSDARHGSPCHLHRAMRKYGIENVAVEPLVLVGDDLIDEQSLNDGEMLMIRLLRINQRLYNATAGGDGISGWKHSEEAKRRIGAASIVTNHNRTFSDETRRRMSEAKKGKSPSEETLHKKSEALKGRVLSPEHRRKIGDALVRAYCVRGHERTPDNLSKNRTCKACQAAASRRSRRKVDKVGS
jgi:group I intron endonuclease